jgi:hypothetical protein
MNEITKPDFDKLAENIISHCRASDQPIVQVADLLEEMFDKGYYLGKHERTPLPKIFDGWESL